MQGLLYWRLPFTHRFRNRRFIINSSLIHKVKEKTMSKVKEQELYKFCIDNIKMLINGKLSIDKIKKLRDIEFPFDYYIDEYISRKEL